MCSRVQITPSYASSALPSYKLLDIQDCLMVSVDHVIYQGRNMEIEDMMKKWASEHFGASTLLWFLPQKSPITGQCCARLLGIKSFQNSDFILFFPVTLVKWVLSWIGSQLLYSGCSYGQLVCRAGRGY